MSEGEKGGETGGKRGLLGPQSLSHTWGRAFSGGVDGALVKRGEQIIWTREEYIDNTVLPSKLKKNSLMQGITTEGSVGSVWLKSHELLDNQSTGGLQRRRRVTSLKREHHKMLQRTGVSGGKGQRERWGEKDKVTQLQGH